MDIGAIVNNQYQVIEHIGRGGMADVWSARDTRLKRMVAIKTIVAGLGSDLDPITLFKREAHTIAQMEHPHILPIYDFGEYDSSLYIVMRYVTGGSLEDMMRAGPLHPEEVLRLGDAIGRALDYAHENNVIHLDLKPPNILLDSSKSPYLADFGLATVLDPEGRARNPGSGTLLYMAPEQFIAEMIDHRADIYSFTIMLFHMLTGRLPFEGNAPLAMKQMQMGEELPYIDDYVSSLPYDLTQVLRLGTAQDATYRPATHMELMEQVRAVLKPAPMGVISVTSDEDFKPEFNPYTMVTEADIDFTDSGLFEAVDIYSRAVYDWQNGQGRFLLGVTHFMLMCGYYQNAEDHKLSIDEAGYQMLLRGAIEYDYELEYWWRRVDNASRRWVCLHALRSGNAPARIRALYFLETLPDQDGQPIIPKLVAQTLEIETDNAAKKAAFKVLATRAKLMKRHNIDIMTEYRGRLLHTMTRLGIQIREPAFWQVFVYSPEVDQLIAEEAFDNTLDVAEDAARTVGKMRSLAGVKYLAEQQQNGRKGALDALAFVRDEAPALPEEVSREARFYAWVTNTIRRLVDKPLEGILRFVLALIGGWIAMGDHVYTLFFSTQLLSAARWGNALGLGLIFGLIVAITFYLTDEVSRRLQGFWSWWMRLGLTGILGYVMATLLFAAVRWIFYNDPEISWDLMRFLGAAMAFALVASASLQLRGWRGIFLTTLSMFLPIYAAYRIFYAPTLGNDFTIAPFAAIALLLGIFCGWRATQLSVLDFQWPLGKWLSLAFSFVLGLIWAGGTWVYFLFLIKNTNTISLTWDHMLWMTALMVLLGAALSYWLPRNSRITFGLTAMIAFSIIYALVVWQFFDYTYTIPLTSPSFEVLYYDGTPLIPATPQLMFAYATDKLDGIFTVTLPMVFVVALAVNVQALILNWLSWIGEPKADKERGGWLSVTLIYVLVMTGMVSILALFSASTSILWALGWSSWGIITFILALATYQWAKWGANGLTWSAIFLIFAGFFFDYVNMRYMASQGNWPAYLQVIPFNFQLVGMELSFTATQLYFWAIWSAVIGILAWGAQRRALWAGIGLVVMLIGWVLLSLFSPLQGSIAVFVMTNVALLAFSLAPKYELMEAGRFQMPRLRPLPLPPVASLEQRALTELHKARLDDALPTQVMTMPPPSKDGLAPTELKTVGMEAVSHESEQVYERDETEFDPQVNLADDEDTWKYEVDTSPFRQADPNLIYSQVNAKDALPDEIEKTDTEPKIRFDSGHKPDQRTVRYDRPETSGSDDDEDE
jgi:hypothetical protein